MMDVKKWFGHSPSAIGRVGWCRCHPTFQTVAILAVLAVCRLPFARAAEPAQRPTASKSATPEQIQKLIVRLGNPEYYARQQSEVELTQLGFNAIDALEEAASHEDLEVAARAARVLQAIKSNWAAKDDSPDVSRLLVDYEVQEYAQRESRARQLAQLPNATGIPALCRVIRFERSPLLSKWAAVWLLDSVVLGETPKDIVAEKIRKVLADSRRPAAQWILAWLRMKDDADAVGETWTKLVDVEQGLASRHSPETADELIERLVRFQIGWLRKLDRTDDAMLAVERLVDLERDDPRTLSSLMNWLIAQKDWDSLRRVEERFKTAIAKTPSLLYMVAEAQADRGAAKEAADTALRAFKLKEEVDDAALRAHYAQGYQLQSRGRLDWARREFECVLQNADSHSPLAVLGAHTLGEMLHDLEQDQQAADVLKRVVDVYAAKENEFVLPNFNGVDRATIGSVRARLNYFTACRWKSEGDRAKERANLEVALNTDCFDIEVLIACYQLPDSKPEFSTKIRKMIAKTLCSLREQIADNGDDATSAVPCNEFAWLVGNTEGDFEEAIRYSKRSIELSDGDAGGYYDTLARVYFAKGDYKEAVINQSKAAELSPHIRAVGRQLELFKKKAKEKGIQYEIPKTEKGSGNPADLPEGEGPADDPFGENTPARPVF